MEKFLIELAPNMFSEDTFKAYLKKNKITDTNERYRNFVSNKVNALFHEHFRTDKPMYMLKAIDEQKYRGNIKRFREEFGDEWVASRLQATKKYKNIDVDEIKALSDEIYVTIRPHDKMKLLESYFILGDPNCGLYNKHSMCLGVTMFRPEWTEQVSKLVNSIGNRYAREVAAKIRNDINQHSKGEVEMKYSKEAYEYFMDKYVRNLD